MINSQNYYKSGMSSGKQVDQYENSRLNRILVTTSSVIGLVSVMSLIAINVATLIQLTRNQGKDNSVSGQINVIEQNTDDIKGDLKSVIKPQLNLINTATGYTIPGYLNNQLRELRNELYQVCTPKYTGEQNMCPVAPKAKHVGPFQLYNPEVFLNCTMMIRDISATPAFNLTTFASFVPSGTNPYGCMTTPTFSLSDYLYSYSHLIVHDGCNEQSESAQYWSIGRIAPGRNMEPVFEEIINWYMNDHIVRRSCSTTASKLGSWLTCSSIFKTTIKDDHSAGAKMLVINYMDIFGRKKFWEYQINQISTDYEYDSIITGVGSGVIYKGKVYTLIYGALKKPIDTPAFCIISNCKDATQELCNKAQRPDQYGGKQVVLGILQYEDNPEYKPNITITTVSPHQYPIGSEGRIYRDEYSNKFYIYLKSASWYSYLLYGEINLGQHITINWYNYKTITRPGKNPCGAGHMCPVECLTGVYNDFFMLSLIDGFGVTVMLTGGYLRRGPAIRLADVNFAYVTKVITTPIQVAHYTTTTCFMYDERPWCVSIVEFLPGTIGVSQPISLLYPIWSSCEKGRDLSDVYIIPTNPIPTINTNLSEEINNAPEQTNESSLEMYTNSSKV
uniref:Hemagglutinin-neuraminidase n=1 Tax=Otomops bat paramyxovirus TaxID=3141897 RepID=A0AAU7E3G0_9MONO